MPVLKVGNVYMYNKKLYELAGVESRVVLLKDLADSRDLPWHIKCDVSEVMPVENDQIALWMTTTSRPIIMDEDDRIAWEKYLKGKNGTKTIKQRF